jgi:hypothetical protein
VVLTKNQPSEFSRQPYSVFLAQAFAFYGSETRRLQTADAGS